MDALVTFSPCEMGNIELPEVFFSIFGISDHLKSHLFVDFVSTGHRSQLTGPDHMNYLL